MAAEVPGSDVSVTAPLQQPQQEQLDKDPEVAKVEGEAEVKSSEQVIDSSSSKETKEMNMRTTEVTNEGEGMKKDENLAHDRNPEAPVSKAEELPGVKHDANVDSNEHTGNAAEAEVPTNEVTTETQIEAQPKIEACRETVEEKTESVPEEPEQAVNVGELPADVENKEEDKPKDETNGTRAVDVIESKVESVPQPEVVSENAAEESLEGNSLEKPQEEQVKENEEEKVKPEEETEVTKTTDVDQSLVEETSTALEANPAKVGGLNGQAEDVATKVSDPVQSTGEDESKKAEKPLEAEPFRQEVVGEVGKDSNQRVQAETVQQEVVKVEELASRAEPANVEEEKQEQSSKVQEEPKEQINETTDGSESKSEPSIKANEEGEPVERAIPPIEEKTKENFEEKPLGEVEADPAKDSVVAPAHEGESKEEQNAKCSDAVAQMEKAIETEKTQENGEVIRKASLGDMLKEENETKQNEEIRKETATPEPEKAELKTKETIVEKSFVPSTEEVKTRDVQVTPPAADKEKKKVEKSSAPPVEAEKNGLKEEETNETEIKAEEKNREEVVTKPSSKQSNNILSKVKHSFVKAKKAIIGKSPSSKTISTDISKGEVKVK